MKICESHPAKFAVFGGKEDVEPCEMVADGIGPAAVNLCGKTTLRELTALLHKCTLVISNDSGAMHLAAAVGTHVIAIFGSTDPTRTAPPENCTIMKKDVPCSPCFKRECPTDFRCMTSISVEEVSRKVSELLSSFASGGSRGNRPRGHRTFRSPNGPAAPSRSERRTAGHS
jgi:heptosyltransferase-2